MPFDYVCRKQLREDAVKHLVIYKGKSYHFCCEACGKAFDEKPGKYLKVGWFQRFLNNLQEANDREFKGNRPSCH